MRASLYFFTFFVKCNDWSRSSNTWCNSKGERATQKCCQNCYFSLSLFLWIFFSSIILWGWVELIKTEKRFDLLFVLYLVWSWCLYRSGRHQDKKNTVFCVLSHMSLEKGIKVADLIFSLFCPFLCLHILLYTKFTHSCKVFSS